MKYQLFIALRYLRARHKQVFTTVITIISILGIAIGVMALVVALSLMTGMHDQIRENILGSRAHITMYAGSSEKTIKNFEEIRSEILAIDGVIGAAPLVREYGLVQGQYGSQGCVIHAINPAESDSVINVHESIIEGNWTDLGKLHGEFDRKGVLVGYALARDIGAVVGSDILVYAVSNAELTPAGAMPRLLKLKVVGIFETSDWMADSRFVFVPISYMQQALRLGEGITMMQVKVDDIFRAEEMRDEIRSRVGDNYLYATWIEENTMFFEALQLEKLAMFLTITLIVTVAALNIVSTLIMLVMEKNRDIGVLRSMGAGSRGILLTFMLQGLIIGLIGTGIGAVLGSAIAFGLDYYNVIQLPGEVYTITSVQFKIVPMDIAAVCGIALLISLLATIYPAWKAARLRPSEALRYE